MPTRRILERSLVLFTITLVLSISNLPISISESGQNQLTPIGPPGERLSAPPAPREAKVIPGDLVIKYKEVVLPSENEIEKRDSILRKLANGLNDEFGSETIAIYPEMGWIRIQIPPHVKPDPAEKTLTQNKKIEYWMRNYEVTLHSHTMPPPTSDWLWNTHFESGYPSPLPNYSHLWGLDKIGMQNSWKLSHTQGGVVFIATLDTGIDLEHPDLRGNYVTGKAFCGRKKNDVMDKDGHGTFVAGIIGAKGDNGANAGNQFFVGVNKTAKILPIKIDCGNGPNIADAIAGINFAVGQGAAVINGSWGFYGLDKNDRQVRLLKGAIEAGRNTTLYVASMGNEHRDFNTCLTPTMWPQMFSLDNLANLLVVAATDPSDNLWAPTPAAGPACAPSNRPEGSNYGDSVGHLAAPGSHIWSTRLISQSGSTGDPIKDFVMVADGTSGSAPFASGCAALVQYRQISINPGSPLSPSQLKSVLMTSGTTSGGLNGKVVNGKRLNCYEALQKIQSITPP